MASVEDAHTTLPAPIPDGVPEGVRLVDHHWLDEQAAHGARLALLEQADLRVVDETTEAYRAELNRALADLNLLEERLATEKTANEEHCCQR